MSARPDFMVIGAMKCATSTLHEQLARQPGLFMSTPKEPNFFSDDDVHARGMAWYEALFADAPAGSLRPWQDCPTCARSRGPCRGRRRAVPERRGR